uniref:Uncharacterized protein n=1 Tax=Arundo donax TaxID=35708 RepID=A0A0A9C5K1_ARUDO
MSQPSNHKLCTHPWAFRRRICACVT